MSKMVGRCDRVFDAIFMDGWWDCQWWLLVVATVVVVVVRLAAPEDEFVAVHEISFPEMGETLAILREQVQQINGSDSLLDTQPRSQPQIPFTAILRNTRIRDTMASTKLDLGATPTMSLGLLGLELQGAATFLQLTLAGKGDFQVYRLPLDNPVLAGSPLIIAVCRKARPNA
jgi:hypothetical protein